MFEVWLIILSLISGLIIGVIVTKCSLRSRKEKKTDNIEELLGPWRKYVGEDKLKPTDDRCEDILRQFRSFNHIFGCKSTQDIVRNIRTTLHSISEIEDCKSEKVFTISNMTPIRFLGLTTNESTWSYWRSERLAVLSNPNLYLVASILEEFIHQSIHTEMSTEEKIRLTTDIRHNIFNYRTDVRDVLILIWTAVEFDDLLFDMDSNGVEYINHDCIMWGVKKAMEKVSSDATASLFKHVDTLPPKPKTRRCLSYDKRRKNKKENEDE